MISRYDPESLIENDHHLKIKISNCQFEDNRGLFYITYGQMSIENCKTFFLNKK